MSSTIKKIWSNILPSSLAGRFILIITIPLIMTQLIGVYIFYVRHWYNVSAYMSSLTTNEIKLVVDNHVNDKRQDAQKIAKALNLNIKFYPVQKLIIADDQHREEFGIFQDMLNQNIVWRNNVTHSRDNNIVVAFELPDGVLEFVMTSKRVITPTTFIFVCWIFGMSLLFLFISLIFSRNQIKSIVELAKAANDFGKGFFYEFRPSGAQEVRSAGIAFIKMRERIERQIAKRTQMLAMISHDLKTPLTRMKIQLELLPESSDITDMQQDVIDMQHIIDSYLDFARGEGGEQYQATDLQQFTTDYVIQSNWGNIEINIDKKKPKYSKSTQIKYLVNVKQQAFKRAIANIINNAEKYSNSLLISFDIVAEYFVITIEDNGIGIDDNEKHKVFAPFYRSDNARNLSNSSSVGLGLAITREIILGHGGLVSLHDSVRLGGLLVKITLPLIEQKSLN